MKAQTVLLTPQTCSQPGHTVIRPVMLLMANQGERTRKPLFFFSLSPVHNLTGIDINVLINTTIAFIPLAAPVWSGCFALLSQKHQKTLIRHETRAETHIIFTICTSRTNENIIRYTLKIFIYIFLNKENCTALKLSIYLFIYFHLIQGSVSNSETFVVVIK